MKSDLSHVKTNHEDLVMKHIDDETINVSVPEVMEETIEVVPHKEVPQVHFIDDVVKMPVMLQKAGAGDSGRAENCGDSTGAVY